MEKETEKIETELEITTDDLKPSLWVRLLDELLEKGIEFGTKYSMRYLEDRLGCKADTLKFGIYISSINDQLAPMGYYLSSREQKDEGYIVLVEESAESIASARVRRSFRDMMRAMALFGGIARNPKAKITEDTKRRLLAREEKAGIRLALMKTPMKFAPLIKRSEIDSGK